MRIIVCMKQICLTYARTGTDPERHFLAPEDHVYRINPYDEVALELGLCLREEEKGGDVIILTLGPLIAEAELRRCLAMGARDCVWIDVEDETDPWRKSILLSRAISELGAGLVLCGKESLDRQNGQVGAFLAHHLKVPYVSAIMDICVKDKGAVNVIRAAGRGMREKIECPLPAVFSVDLGMHEPRLPTYEDKVKAWSFEMRPLAISEKNATKKTISSDIFPPRPRPKKVPVPDSRLDSFERINQLLMESHIDKKGEILEGKPELQVEGIISFLQDNGFLGKKK